MLCNVRPIGVTPVEAAFSCTPPNRELEQSRARLSRAACGRTLNGALAAQRGR